MRAVAVKCDLCSFDEQGPACVRTCPTKALILVNIRDIARTSKRKRELTINTDFGDLSLCRRLTRGRNERDDD
jgi:formate hydrogenlyase subunit 2